MFNYGQIHPHVALHLAQWLSPLFLVDVVRWVGRYLSGDLSLIPEIVERHDVVNNTTSKVIVSTIDNELLERERRISVTKEEQELEERRICLMKQDAEVHKLLLENKKVELDNMNGELDTKERELSLEKQQAEQEFELEDKRQEREHQRVQLLREAEQQHDVHSFIAVKNALVGPASEQHRDIPELQNVDLSTIAYELGCTAALTQNVLCKLGCAAVTEYRRRHGGTSPPKTKKHCNGALRDINMYPPTERKWLDTLVKAHLVFAGVLKP